MSKFVSDNHASSAPSVRYNSISSSASALQSSTSSRQTGVVISVSAPGKVILHGEHSVVHGKLAIAASLGLRTKLTLVELDNSQNESNVISIVLHALNLVHSYDLDHLKTKLLDVPLPLVKNASSFNWEKPELINHEVLLEMTKTYVTKSAGSVPLNNYQDLALSSLFYLFTAMLGSVSIPILPFNLVIETDLTVSAGTGSSASYLVCLAAAFAQYIRIKMAKVQELSKNGYKSIKPNGQVNLNVFEQTDLDLISKWAHCAEQIIHGTASDLKATANSKEKGKLSMTEGIDNTICTYGSMVEFRKGNPPKVVEVRHNFKVLLVNTKVSRDTKAMVERLNSIKESQPLIVESILNAMEQISQSALEYLKSLSMLSSNQSIPKEALNAQTIACYAKLGQLTDMNQCLLKALEVSHPTLDIICTILKQAGLNGKLTGAGGGGYAIALIPPQYPKIKITELIDRLQQENFEAIVTDLGGPGVTVDN